jgi:tRNA threonylcarbamoyladenosine biosynthesis protein TsaE
MKTPARFISRSPDETRNIGAKIAKAIAKKPPAVMVGLIGDLGAGKTVLVQGMARGLGISSEYYVHSPTFTLINEYRGEYQRMEHRLTHLDLYRIERPSDVLTLGLDDYLPDPGLIVIEWVERSPELRKQLDYEIRIEIKGEKGREIEVIAV